MRRLAIGGDARAVKGRPAWAWARRLAQALGNLGEGPARPNCAPGPAAAMAPALVWLTQADFTAARAHLAADEPQPHLWIWLSLGPSPSAAYVRWRLATLLGEPESGRVARLLLLLGCPEPQHLPRRLLAAVRAPGVGRIVVEMGCAEAQGQAIAALWAQGCVGALEAALRQSCGRVVALVAAPAPVAALLRPFVRLGPIL